MAGLASNTGIGVAALAALLVCSAAHAASPQRVVSINLCTDQMAMLVAAPGQLLSVSHLAASDPSSAMPDEARAYRPNHALAEEVFLMEPDLVLAGTFSNADTIGLLRRLGIRVEQFPPESSIDDIRANYIRVGELLGQAPRAAALVDEMDRNLAELARRAPTGKSVAAYHANSYSVGRGTLLDSVFTSAGLRNIAAEYGVEGVGRLPLELLVMAAPDLLVDGDREYRAPALAQQNFAHPAYEAVAAASKAVEMPGRYTICGTPYTIEAAKLLRDAAEAP